MKIEKRGIILQFDENTLTYSMERDHQTWKWPKNYVPRMICEEGEFCFRDACQISHEVIHFGTGEGIHSRFKGFKKTEKRSRIILRPSCGSKRQVGMYSSSGSR